MPTIPLALPTGTSIGRASHAGVATTINCYAEDMGPEQKSQMQIWAAPGLDLMTTLVGSGGVRSVLEVDGVVKAVVGRVLYQIDSGGSATVIGGIPSDGYVGMARNQRGSGVETIIACDGLSYVETGGSLSRITDPDLPGAVDVCVVNRSAIFAIPDGRMFRSDIDNASSVDGLDVAQAESAPDRLHRVVDRGGDLIALGPRSTEVWVDGGGEAFGFGRQYVTRIGSIGPRSVTKASVISGQTVTDTVAWIANDQNGSMVGVVLLDGATPRKVSSTNEDRMIAAVPDKSSIVASSYVMGGQGFITFALPGTTLVYNTGTQRWHERQSRTPAGAATAWRVGTFAVMGGRVLAGHKSEPKLYWMDQDTYDEDGDELVMMMRTPPIHAFPDAIEMNGLYLDVVPGVGLANGATQDTNPVVTMRIGKDNQTWSGERTRALGRQGERAKRANWTSIGTFDTATIEFSCSAAVARGFMSAGWDGRVIRR